MIEPHRARGREWLFAAVSLALAAAIAFFLGFTFWSVLLIAILIACPVVIVWTYFMGQRPLPIPLGRTPETRGDTRYFDWVAPWYAFHCSLFGLGKRFRNWMLALARAELRSGDRVLDVGCGNGVLTHPLADIVGPTGEAWGIDPAPDMIRAAMQATCPAGNIAHFKLAAIEELPFPDTSFDAALISLVLHHLPPDLKVVGLREVHRVLKPGGRLLVIEPDRPDHWAWRILVWPMRLYRNLRDHVDGKTPGLLQNAGFVSVRALGRWAHWLTFWIARKPA